MTVPLSNTELAVRLQYNEDVLTDWERAFVSVCMRRVHAHIKMSGSTRGTLLRIWQEVPDRRVLSQLLS